MIEIKRINNHSGKSKKKFAKDYGINKLKLKDILNGKLINVQLMN